MGDDLGDLLAEHYRRKAEGIEPGAALLDRYRRAGRPARAWPARMGPLALAASVVLAVLAGCLLWRGHHATVPVTPPPAGGTSQATPTPSRTTSTPVRRPPATGTPSPRSPGTEATPYPSPSVRPTASHPSTPQVRPSPH